MTVAELISQLQTMPQMAKCLIYSPERRRWIDLVSIEQSKKFDNDVIYLQVELDIV